MGNVYRGIDQRTNSPVAIKILKSELATQEMVRRFIREGEALRQLNHPNIVMLLDAVQENDQHYLIMELVEGGALDKILDTTPRLPLKEVLNIALDLSDALTRAHRLNIIHRDIKPANVLIASDGMPRLTDFGIAHTLDSDITQTGTAVGTAAYMSPELLQGDPADPRSDIWSFGIMLFEMLAGSHPFKTSNPGALIYSILNQPLPDLEALRPDISPALADLINRMTNKNPDERIPRMRLVGAELEALLSGTSSKTTAGVQAKAIPVTNDELTSRFATSSPVIAAVNAIQSNLPIQTTPFVGREHELAELEKIVRDPAIRLLTILAPGGMGKTRLALELAGKMLHQTRATTAIYENGIYFVDLAPLSSTENMVQTVAEATGYTFQQDGRDAKQQLLGYLHEKDILLLMDNFEHLIDGRSLVQDILQSAPSVKFLATSREKLNLSAETVFILSGMDFPTWETPKDALEYGAVKLFMQSARRVRADFQLEVDDLAFVARICRMVQGSPLGILLAAAWLETLSPSEIARELAQSMDFLETDMHDLPERQRSLRAVFEYSWNLLTEQERDLFPRFSVFRGGFTREAAQEITGATLRSLTTMINKSLLRRDNVSGRYEIHELLRQYAEEKLIASNAINAVQDAHSKYYSGLLAQHTPTLKGHGQLKALNVIETDFENIRAAWIRAVQRKDAETASLALEGLYLFLTLRNRFMDGEQLFRLARQSWSAEDGNPSLLAGRVLVRYPEKSPLPLFRRGLEIAQRFGDKLEIAFCERLVGHWLSHTQFNQGEGVPLLEASLKHYEELGDSFYVAQLLDDLGWSYNLMMNQTTQVTLVKRSLDLRREMGDKIGMANSLRNMGGSVGGFIDTTDRAFGYWQEAKEIAYEMNDRLGVAWNASLQAANLIFQGEFERASRLLDEGYPYAADINDPIVKGFILVLRGIIVALRDEDYIAAQKLIDEGFPPGTPPDFRMTLVPFGTVLAGCGTRNFQRIQTYIADYFVAAPFNHPGFFVPIFMPYFLVSMSETWDKTRVVEFMRAFFDVTVSYINQPFPMAWAKRWKLLTRLREHLEAELGSSAFQAAWERGLHLPMETLTDEIEKFLGRKT